jgi:mono/diheme cytochrome c family protein
MNSKQATSGATKLRSTSLVLLVIVAACTTGIDPLEDYEELEPTRIMTAPAVEAGGGTERERELVARGEYLVELIGCAVCHTDGALIGEPRYDAWLAGSDVGIAYSNPMKYDNPGIVFPPNLTPDPSSGLGRWSDEQISAAIRHGADSQGRRLIQAMPWLVYEKISDEDTRAIVAYLRHLPPIDNKVPDNVSPGSKTEELYVHFGIYRSRR